MRYFLTIPLILIALQARSQNRAEAIFRSMMPIEIKIHFWCSAENRTHDWEQTIDASGDNFKTNFGLMDSVSFTLSESKVHFYATCGASVQSHFLGMAGTIDTALKALSLIVQEFNYGEDMLNYDGMYSQTDSHIVVFAHPGQFVCGTEGLQHFSCGQLSSSGFLATGGAPPPQGVEARRTGWTRFQTFVGGSSVRFSSNDLIAAIIIFDLLGREVARIDVPAGAESAELSTSHIPPGMYIAQMGTQAVKFVVR